MQTRVNNQTEQRDHFLAVHKDRKRKMILFISIRKYTVTSYYVVVSNSKFNFVDAHKRTGSCKPIFSSGTQFPIIHKKAFNLL